MRLIDADALPKLIIYQPSDEVKEIINVFTRAIAEAPTIDAAEVRHGKWIPLYPHEVPITNEYKCSVCGLGFDEDEETECAVYYTFKYCPHCGARMEGVEE